MNEYSIGDEKIILNGSLEVFYEDEYMEKFPAASDAPEESCIRVQIKYRKVQELCTGTPLHSTGLYELYKTEKGYFLMYHWASCRFAFGFYQEDLYQKDPVTYYIDPDMKSEQKLALVRFLSCAGLHSLYLQKQALIFHASYIQWNSYGLLFCGSSGMGKSTQAALWEQHAGARTINGDRCLLRVRDGKWHVYGYPCCGSSKICENHTLPIRAIIVLAQGEDNVIEDMTYAQKVKALMAGTERYWWDERELDLVSRMAMKLVQEVPMVKFTCCPDETAVQTLRDYIETMGK